MTALNDRRAAPRRSVRCPAALASGTAVVAVELGDISDKGCRVRVAGGGAGLPGSFGETGLLAIQAPGRARAGVVVPVVLRRFGQDGAAEGGALLCGLEFRPATPRQAALLAAVVARLRAGPGRIPAPAAGQDPAAGPAAARG